MFLFDANLRSAVVDYLEKNGYLTRGFVGEGPVKMGFVEDCENEPDAVVGLKVISVGDSLKCEVAAVKIFGQNGIDNYRSATKFANRVFANKCFLAGSFTFDADDKGLAARMGIGLLEIQESFVREVVPAEFVKSRFIELPKHKFEGLRLAEKLLELSEDDWGLLARVFCRTDDAWCGFNIGDVFVELRKSFIVLEVNISVRADPIKKRAEYVFKFGELAGFLVFGKDDRYTFVEKLGNMFVFTQTEWNFMLNLLSKVDMCHLVFHIGTARILFAKHPGQEGLDLFMDFVDGRESHYEHHYSQEDLGELTRKKK
jgi:hypothetical protein